MYRFYRKINANGWMNTEIFTKGCTSPEKTDTSVFVFWLICCWVYKQKVMLRSRSQSGINGTPYGLPPFIPFARLSFAPPSAEEGSCNFSFEKSGSFSGL